MNLNHCIWVESTDTKIHNPSTTRHLSNIWLLPNQSSALGLEYHWLEPARTWKPWTLAWDHKQLTHTDLNHSPPRYYHGGKDSPPRPTTKLPCNPGVKSMPQDKPIPFQQLPTYQCLTHRTQTITPTLPRTANNQPWGPQPYRVWIVQPHCPALTNWGAIPTWCPGG